jgi:hypothetical protein
LIRVVFADKLLGLIVRELRHAIPQRIDGGDAAGDVERVVVLRQINGGDLMPNLGLPVEIVEAQRRRRDVDRPR